MYQNPKAIDPNGKKVTKLRLELAGSWVKALDRQIMVRREPRFPMKRESQKSTKTPSLSKISDFKALSINLYESHQIVGSERLSKVEVRERESCDKMRKRELR